MKNKLGNNIFFDSKMGLVGALFLATIVLFINMDYGFEKAWPAAAKQGVYTFFAGGFLMRFTENLAIKWEGKIFSYAMAVFIPTTISILLTFGVHSLKGTPEPLLSTLPTAILSPFGFFWWAYKKRNKLS